TLYASVPASATADDSWIWVSHDSGLTWKWITASHPAIGKPVPCNGGGDTELAVDPVGRLYFNDLTLANFSVGRSDDGGSSLLCNTTGAPNTTVDRQWYAVDGDPLQGTPSGSTANAIFLGSNVVGQGGPNCPVSGAGNNALVLYRSSITTLPPATAGLQ